MKQDLASGLFSLLNAKFIISIISIFSLPVIIRVLGPAGYGDYAFVMSTFSLLMVLVSSGVTEGVQKFIAEDRSSTDWQERVLGFYVKLAISLAVIGCLTIALITWVGLIQHTLGGRFEMYFYLLAVLVITTQIRSVTRRSLLGLGLEPYSESISVVGKITWVGTGLGLAVAGFGVAGLLVAKSLSALVVIVLGSSVLARRISFKSALSSGTASLPYKEMLSFNVFNIILVLLMMSLYHVDVLMLGVMTNSKQTGYYKAALALAQYMWLVPTAIQTLLLHSASDLWSRDKVQVVNNLSSKITRYIFLFTSLLAVGVFTLADQFVPLYYGEAFSAALKPLIFLLPGALGFALARPLYGINKASGQLVPLIFAISIAAIANVVLNATLIPVYGIVGAAIATSISYGSMFMLQVACARYLGYDPLDGVRPVRLVATLIISTPLILGLESVFSHNWIALIIVPGGGFVLYWIIAVICGAIDSSEIYELATASPVPIEQYVHSLLS